MLDILRMHLPRQSRQEHLSIAYITAVVAKAGYDCGRPGSLDVGEDLEIYTVLKKNNKIFKPGPNLYIQAKSSQNFETSDDGEYIKYDLEVDTYNKLILEEYGMYPIILVLYCMPADEDDWLNICEDNTVLKYCGYWTCLMGNPISTNTSTQRIYIPKNNIFTSSALTSIMDKIRRKEALNG